MQRIEISDADYERLKALAEPFVDTPATVIGRLLDWHCNSPKAGHQGDINQRPVILTEIPPLTHTKFLDGKLEGTSPDKKSWDSFLLVALNAAFERLSDVDELRRASGANLKNGRKEDEGYKFLPDKGYSYQGVSAEDAMKIVHRICKHFNWQCELEFEWRDKEDAFLPGRRAHLNISGNFVNGGVN